MIKQAFKIEDILTITTGVLMTKESIGGGKRLTAFLFGDMDGSVFDITLSLLLPKASSRLLKQFPELPTEEDAKWVDASNVEQFLETQKQRFGSQLDVALGEPSPHT